MEPPGPEACATPCGLSAVSGCLASANEKLICCNMVEEIVDSKAANPIYSPPGEGCLRRRRGFVRPGLCPVDERVKNKEFGMSGRAKSTVIVLNAMVAISLVAAASSTAFAQNGKQAAQKTKASAASNKPFDPHDLSGFWDITNTGRPAGALNET